jgi:membrane peptidoglycan carboxypeptidase
VIKIAKKSGLNGKFRNDLTISLGSQESTLLDMVAAYATIINDGVPVFPYGIKYVTSDEKILYEHKMSEKKPIVSKKTLENMKYLLYCVINEGTGKEAKVDSLINKTIAYNMLNEDNKFFIGGKTGSTKNNNDAWFIGFTDDIILGIWIGNDDNQRMSGIMGGNLPAKLWKNIIGSIT